jgi:hypothetical protein
MGSGGPTLTSSLSLPKPVPRALRPAWTQSLGARLRGLALAREKHTLLVWDENHWVHLLNRNGDRQGQVRTPRALVAAACAEDGSAYVAVGGRGEVWWLNPDLTMRWERGLPRKAEAVALDPFGQYAAVSDVRGGLHVFDRHGTLVSQTQTPRALHYLAFVPAAAFLLGSADYGLVGCYDLAGRCVWRDGLVAHVGSLAVSGDGGLAALACFTEGLQCYNVAGKNLGRLTVGEPCRLAALSFDGRHILAAGLSNRLLLLDGTGHTQAVHPLDKQPVGVALGALADRAVTACGDGTVLCFDLRESTRP